MLLRKKRQEIIPPTCLAHGLAAACVPSNNGLESSAVVASEIQIRHVAVLECAIVPSEKTDTMACNELRMLMRHRAVGKDKHVGVQRITDADAPSCRQKRQTRRRATKYGCGCAMVPSEKTNTLACNELRVLMRHRAVRKDRHVGVQRITDADATSCRQKRQTRWRATNYGCWWPHRTFCKRQLFQLLPPAVPSLLHTIRITVALGRLVQRTHLRRHLQRQPPGNPHSKQLILDFSKSPAWPPALPNQRVPHPLLCSQIAPNFLAWQNQDTLRVSNLLDGEPQNRLRQLDGADDPKHVPSETARPGKAPAASYVDPCCTPWSATSSYHQLLPECLGRTEDHFETSYPHVPAARIDLYHTK